jgi:hypothetical protein
LEGVIPLRIVFADSKSPSSRRISAFMIRSLTVRFSRRARASRFCLHASEAAAMASPGPGAASRKASLRRHHASMRRRASPAVDQWPGPFRGRRSNHPCLVPGPHARLPNPDWLSCVPYSTKLISIG